MPALPPLHYERPLNHRACALCAQLSQGVWHVLIHLVDMVDAEATWEPVKEFWAIFPEIWHEDELLHKEERCYGGELLPPLQRGAMAKE